ncbi:hypothetical protein D9M68_788500 [compost metagenome]
MPTSAFSLAMMTRYLFSSPGALKPFCTSMISSGVLLRCPVMMAIAEAGTPARLISRRRILLCMPSRSQKMICLA